MDGTLLNSQRVLSEAVIHALQKAEAAGIVVCLASGRALSTLRPFQRQAGISGPLVTCNGAYVLDHDGGELAHHHLDPGVAARVLAIAESLDVHVNVYEKSRIHLSKTGGFAEVYARRTGVNVSLEDVGAHRSAQATKILLMDEPSTITSLIDRFLVELGADEAVMVRSEADYLEFLPPGINKGKGVERVADSLGISFDQVAALGDYDNDVEMLVYAGFSGAMANGADRVKEIADVIVPTNDEGGAVEFIDRVLRHNQAF
jgi:Cof subfamily protein (haloacid dehalogenase superfamily)